MEAKHNPDAVAPDYDPALDPALRLGGVALANGLIVVSLRYWAAAVREADGSISVASGKKPCLPGTTPKTESPTVGDGSTPRKGERVPGGESDGIPMLRGLGRLAESILVLGLVKKRLPSARLPLESGRVATALVASMAGATALRALVPRSALAQEAGTALAAFIPAAVAVKNSDIAGYHGAEHKVIGAREEALRARVKERGGARRTADRLTGDPAAASKEHDRCGSNLVGPYLFATVLTGVLVRDRRGRKTPVRSAAAGVASLGLALEAMRWASRHGESLLARVMMLPGRVLQKSLTTSEPTPEQLEVGERALAEVLRLEAAGG